MYRLFPAYLVRMAGFSFSRLAALRCPRSAASAPAVDDALAACSEAKRSLESALDRVRFAELRAFDDPANRKSLSRAFQRVRDFARAGVEAEPPREAIARVVEVVAALAEVIEAACVAQVHAKRAVAELDATFADEFARARIALRRMFDDVRLQEAVFIESAEAYEKVRSLSSELGSRNSRERAKERVAAMYAQRFCAKNDTNSICGPLGIAWFDDDGVNDDAAIELVTDDARRVTYFSHWAAELLLAEAVKRAGPAAPVTYRLHPSARVDGSSLAWCVMEHDATSVFRRRYRRATLSDDEHAVVAALAQPRAVAEVAARFQIERDELVAFIDQLVAAGVVVRGPSLPPGLFYPLRAVADEIASWPDSDARAAALADVSALEDLVSAFASAPLARRTQLYQQLAARFVAATGSAATRGAGQHYADRSLLHEDCFIATRTTLGNARPAVERTLPSLIAALELPVELARERMCEWFATRFGDRRVPWLEVHRAYDEERVLETRASTAAAERLRAGIAHVRAAIARAVGETLDGSARITSADLHEAVAQAAPRGGARFVSADVMVQRLADGRVEAVIGEVHGFCWLTISALDVLPPEARDRVVAEMRSAMRAMAHGITTTELVFAHTQATDRRFAVTDRDLALVIDGDRPRQARLGAIELALVGNELAYFDGAEEIIPVAVYSKYPFVQHTSKVVAAFDDHAEHYFPTSLLPETMLAGDTPRLYLDDVVVLRRTWRRSAGEVRAALASSSEVERFRAAQALRAAFGCDACVFVSLPGEPKPVLLDFLDPFLIEALAHLIEKTPSDATVKISEMLPGPDELIASAPDGRRTSELRVGLYRT